MKEVPCFLERGVRRVRGGEKWKGEKGGGGGGGVGECVGWGLGRGKLGNEKERLVFPFQRSKENL